MASRAAQLDLDWPRVVLRFALGIGIIAALGVLAGPSLPALAHADPVPIALAVVCSLGAFTCWFAAFSRSVRTAVPGARHRQLVAPFLLSTVARQVAPAGTLSGVAVGGYLAGRATSSAAERTVGALAVLEVVSMLSASLAVVTGALAAATIDGGFQSGLGDAAPFVGAVVIVTIGGILALAAFSEYIVRAAVFTADLARRPVALVSPTHGARFEREVVRGQVERLVASIRRAATDRRATGTVLAATYVGWLAMGAALYFACLAVGLDVPPWIALLAVPVSGVAGLLPTPGGLGGVEALLAGVIVAATAVPLGPAVTATILFRLVTFWLHLGLGALGPLARPRRGGAI